MEDLKLSVDTGALDLLSRVSQFLAARGIQSYLVGGFVRDMLLGRDTADIDIAVAADALEIAPRIADALGGRYVLLDETNRIGRVVLAESETTSIPKKWELDFSTLRGEIEQDLTQRDFTIDAMAINLENITDESIPIAVKRAEEMTLSLSALIDPHNGWGDIRQGVIRAVSETAFAADAARLIRAVRLAAELDFHIDSQTEALIRQHCHLITDVAGERVREEMLRILAVPGAGKFLAYLDDLGLLTAIIPELTQAKGVEQPTVHFWDVFDHSIQTVNAVDFLLRQGNREYADEEVLAAVPWSETLSQHFDKAVSNSSTRKSILKLAALLHDIAKPQTKIIDDDGRARFLGHPREGAAMAVSIMERLRFSAKETKLVEVMVTDHLRPGQMSNYGMPSNRAIYRYFRDTGEAGIDILFLCLADHLATRGPLLDLSNWQEHARIVDYVLSRHLKEESITTPPKLIDGHDIISHLGLNPGPEIGQLLETVREAQAAGEVTTREEALHHIEHLLSLSSDKTNNRRYKE